MSEVRICSCALRRVALLLVLGWILAVTSSVSAHAAPFQNGEFDSGMLDPWTDFTTPLGSIGASGETQVVMFDTNDDGFDSFAVQLNVGQIISINMNPEGGGIEQTFSLADGNLSISLDIASINPGNTDNGSAGIFQLLFDDVVLDTVDFGAIGARETQFGTLSGAVPTVSAGTHTLAIRVTRPFLNLGGSPTPLQYIDNVVLAGSAVPEPGTAALLATGLLALAVLRSRQRVRA